MSPLRVETYSQDMSKWVQVSEIKPTDPPGSVSQNKPDGNREIYLFECAKDDSHSTIYRSKGGVDTEIGKHRVVMSENFEAIKTLKKGDKPFTLTLKTDVSPQRRLIRFTHR